MAFCTNKSLTRRIVLLFTVWTGLFGCSEHTTTNANETYRLWAGQSPPQEVRVVNGQYWQSSHFTKEYIMYLELYAPQNWIKEYVKQNALIKDTTGTSLPKDKPHWFTPNKDYSVLKPQEGSESSLYFEDTLNGHMFIYEVQL